MQVEPVTQVNRYSPRCRRLRRGFVASAPEGSALITALVFTVIIALALAGIGTLTISHYSLANVQAASSDALDLAEAGVNWELYKLTNSGITSADYGDINYSASTYIAPGLPGTFTVTVAAPGGGPVNANTTKFTITCTGTVPAANNTSARRSVRINAQPYSTFYTLYSSSSTNFTDNGIVVNGISGTNGVQSITSGLSVKPQINSMVFNGTSAPTGPDYDGYKMVSNPKPLPLQGVTDMVNAKYPGGSDYIKAHNDNDLAVKNDPDNPTPPGTPPPKAISSDKYALNTTGHQTVTLVGKPGGANYYLTDINMDGHSDLIFDNTKGPINIYYLNLSGAGIHMRGGHSLQSADNVTDNKVRMFTSSVGAIVVNAADPIPGVANSTEVDMGIYDFDSYVYKGKTYTVGQVNIGPDVDFRGQVTTKIINIGATTNIIGQSGYFETPVEYFGFSGAWSELNASGNVGGANQ